MTLSVTKKPGENAIDVANAVMRRVEVLRNTVIPHDVQVAETRNYGATANDKAQKLIQKLLFATASVVALVFLALGRREAAIVGSAVILTLAATLFASWAWGFTLNRVSLFALIFSIGILVDDAIVVVENIHRHQQLHPGRPLARDHSRRGRRGRRAHHPGDADGDRRAAADGLRLRPDGAVHEPDPDQRQHGHAAVAGDRLRRHAVAGAAVAEVGAGVRRRAAPRGRPWPRGQDRTGVRAPVPAVARRTAAASATAACWASGVAALIAVSLALPAIGLVLLKMLPFDNKSEFQVVVDMPAGTPVEQTAAVLHELGAYLATVPEVTDYQAYAGTAAPINFNGLVRQYYLRAGGEVGDMQVNLVDKHQRSEQSHAIATRVRPALQEIGARFGANVKVVEVPPGPPVLAPIVAEIYGPEAAGRQQVAKAVRAVFATTAGVVDVDDSSIAAAPKTLLLVDRRKAAMLGVPQQAIVTTLRAGLAGEATTYLHDETKYPAAATLQLPPERHGDLDALLQLAVRSADGKLVPIRELVTVSDTRARAAGLPQGPAAGELRRRRHGRHARQPAVRHVRDARRDWRRSPRRAAARWPSTSSSQPDDPYRDYALKWDGESQITYETFRDMGAAYAVGLVLIYLLVVAQFGSYLTPLIIMAPIPLTIIGVMPGHALLGAQYTATSMIGMIALAGIIVRNSILLVDFINLQVRDGVAFKRGRRALGHHPRAADRADRPGGDARRLLHPRRPDLQRPGDLADLRHLRLHPADAGGHPDAVLRGLPQPARRDHRADRS